MKCSMIQIAKISKITAKISALSSNNLDKYEYLTSEDLGLKPSTVEKAKFGYSPLGKIFNKGLSEDNKKEGILKRLENIKGKNDELLDRFATNKSSKNKKNTRSKILIQHKNIDDIKKLSLDSMYNLMKDHHKNLLG